MTRRTGVTLAIGAALLLSGGAAGQAREAGTLSTPHMVPTISRHVVAPPVVHRVPFRNDRAPGSPHFAFHRPDLDLPRPGFRFERRFLRNERNERLLAHRFAPPVVGFWPGIVPDEVVVPVAPTVAACAPADSGCQPADNGAAAMDGPEPAAAAAGGSTVVRHDYPDYTVFDYCRVPTRDIKDCGPEWIVMHPVAVAPAPPASGTAK
jgi:hypothetical protein